MYPHVPTGSLEGHYIGGRGGGGLEDVHILMLHSCSGVCMVQYHIGGGRAIISGSGEELPTPTLFSNV